jgi:hypothetical protein
LKKLIITFFLLSFCINIFAQKLIRGPYLQMGTQTSLVIRWRTDTPTASKVSFGTSLNYSTAKTDFTPKTEHEVVLNNLTPNTKYFYAIGNAQNQFQGDANNFFYTLPPDNTTQKIRFLALGDCGWSSETQVKVKTEFLKYSENKPFHLALLLGDNAYSVGNDEEYQTGFFNPYQELLKKTILYPALGNHDYYSLMYENGQYKGTYFNVFTNPTQGEIGGVPSASEAYYSYNYGNIHFIVLDSYGTEENQTKRLYDTLSPQVQWLKKDLAANKKKWTIAYWHHPPYGKADYDTDKVEELSLIRENLLRILERNGVDLVLCGHAHVYERSYLIRRHYGKAATFRAKIHGVSMSSGKYDGSTNSCPYIKQTHSGTVYVVAGSSAITRDRRAADYPHPALFYSNYEKSGALIVELEDNRLDAKWLCEDGVIRDNFTILKEVNKTEKLSVRKGESIQLNASWIGSYVWQDGKNTRQNSLSAINNATKIFVTDDKKCLADTFQISVLPSAFYGTPLLNAFPNPSENFVDISVEIPSENNYTIMISDLQGNVLKTYESTFLKEGNHQKRIPIDESLKNQEMILVNIFSENYRATKKIKILR